MNQQRTAKIAKDHGLESIMTDERQRLLDKAGFVWEVETNLAVKRNSKSFDRNYSQLQKFYEENGHCK